MGKEKEDKNRLPNIFIEKQAVSKWEMGTLPDMENMVKIGRYFERSLHYLMKDEMDTNSEDKEIAEIPTASNKKTVRIWVSVGLMAVVVILCFLMPLFANLYQAFDFEGHGSSFAYAFDYIFRFPLLSIVLIAVMFIIAGIILLVYTIRNGKKEGN